MIISKILNRIFLLVVVLFNTLLLIIGGKKFYATLKMVQNHGN